MMTIMTLMASSYACAEQDDSMASRPCVPFVLGVLLLLICLAASTVGFLLVHPPPAAGVCRRQESRQRSHSSGSSGSTAMASSIGSFFQGKPDPQALVRQGTCELLQRKRASIQYGSSFPSTVLSVLGMDEFRQGKVQASIDFFDQALELDSRLEPYLWQRYGTDGQSLNDSP